MFRDFFDNIRYTIEDVVQDVKWKAGDVANEVKWRADTVRTAVEELKEVSPGAVWRDLEEEEIKEILDEASKIIQSAKRKYAKEELKAKEVYQNVSKALENHYQFKMNILSNLIYETQEVISEYKGIDWTRRIITEESGLKGSRYEEKGRSFPKSLSNNINSNFISDQHLARNSKVLKQISDLYKKKQEARAYLNRAKVYKEEIELAISQLKILVENMKSVEYIIDDEKIMISCIIEKLNVVLPLLKIQLIKEQVTVVEMREIEYLAKLSELLVQSLNMSCVSDKGSITQQYQKYLKSLEQIKVDMLKLGGE